MHQLTTLRRTGHPLADPRRQLAVLATAGVERFDDVLARHGLAPLEAAAIEVLQVNVGRLCNQTCSHCHVDAGPDRTDAVMSRETAAQCLAVLEREAIPTLDITGGAPELNPQFRFLVEGARALGRRVIDRCNLTVLLLPSQADTVEFLARHEVEIVASLPCYLSRNTDAQRGDRVFERSIRALRRLNQAGYGTGGALRLTLVHNPVGASLPGDQAALERDYRRELAERHGVTFDELYTITNMPIARFLEHLEREGQTARYLDTLVGAFNPVAAQNVMCRTYLSVGWDGRLYDCDFNQMLDLAPAEGAPRTIAELLERGAAPRRIVTDRHCFGCTAGAGSSCAGALDRAEP
ncbi:MAG: radical SAM/Cys-rich domain protein [Acidobacteria bacterium]|nr:MAG: radical SAM/Cys-rich domain protein [Acidobacteriota bacterium]